MKSKVSWLSDEEGEGVKNDQLDVGDDVEIITAKTRIRRVKKVH